MQQHFWSAGMSTAILAIVAMAPPAQASGAPSGQRLAELRQILPVKPQRHAGGQGFGNSVALSGKVLVVGAPKLAVHKRDYAGAAYVFVEPKGGWGGTGMIPAATLTSSDSGRQISPFLGYSVAIDGDTVVLGGSYNANNGSYPREAYVYVKPASGWASMTETARLESPSARYQLGGDGAVAIRGDTIVAECVDTAFQGVGTAGCGAVYVKPAGGWSGKIKPVAVLTDGGQGDSLGFTAAIADDAIALSAPEANADNGGADGLVQVYEKPPGGWANTGTPTATLTPSDPNGGYVGYSLAMSGETIIAGAPYAAVDGMLLGAGYVYVRNGKHWVSATETAKLASQTAAAQDGSPAVGLSAAIFGGTIALGANGITPPNGVFYGGAVFLFKRPPNGWVNTTMEDGVAYAQHAPSALQLGISAALSATTLASGTLRADKQTQFQQGSVDLFDLNSN